MNLADMVAVLVITRTHPPVPSGLPPSLAKTSHPCPSAAAGLLGVLFGGDRALTGAFPV